MTVYCWTCSALKDVKSSAPDSDKERGARLHEAYPEAEARRGELSCGHFASYVVRSR